MTIGPTAVPLFIKERFPEFSRQVDDHLDEWQDDAMHYILAGSLFQFVADMPLGKDRQDAATRLYVLTDLMLADGEPSVRDCFSIEMIEPLVSVSSREAFPDFEAALGEYGKRDLSSKREWLRRFESMSALVTSLNKRLGMPLFQEQAGVGGDTVRIIADLRLWDSTATAIRDKFFIEIKEAWSQITGSTKGVEITAPADSGFAILAAS